MPLWSADYWSSEKKTAIYIFLSGMSLDNVEVDSIFDEVGSSREHEHMDSVKIFFCGLICIPG